MACHPALVPVETESDYVTPSPRENGNPRQDVVLENPALYYSAVKKDKHNLRKKVVRHADVNDYDYDGGWVWMTILKLFGVIVLCNATTCKT